ncbi:conserved hypothetical protein [Methylocella silvestris BL2]|uniref:Cytochrome c oxidase assembly protein n=2 Tax=Methylocella silvestris TaxID=199596 RepID=B8ES72_METSB|nr:conserved hypothetical protein [Methylocella silvestris BL2]
MVTNTYIPYCGAAPTPTSIAWNFDPALLAILAAGALLYAFALRPWDERRRDEFALRPFAFAAGWACLAMVFVSPLCNLSVALFSARIGQHMILALLAAPLLVLGGVDVLVARALRLDSERRGRLEAVAAPIVFAVALWLWHAPQPYDAALQSHFIYWIMEISLLAASVLLWRCLLRGLSLNPGAALAASFFTALQMMGLGALLTFAPRVLFAAHLTTTESWGLSPLQDQQLGGLVMWLPFGLILTLHAVAALAACMREAGRRAHTA